MERTRAALDRLAMLPLFREPERLFEAEAQALDDLSGRLAGALPEALAADRRLLDARRDALSRMLGQLTARPAQRAASLGERLAYQGGVLPDRFANEVAVAAARLNDLSPLTVLARGYSITRDASGAVVRSASQAPAGSRVSVAVADGRLDCEVLSSEEGPPRAVDDRTQTMTTEGGTSR